MGKGKVWGREMVIEFKDVGVEIQKKESIIITNAIVGFLVSEQRRKERLADALRRTLLMGEENISDKYNLFCALSTHPEFEKDEREKVVSKVCDLFKECYQISKEKDNLWEKHLDKNFLLYMFSYIPTTIKSCNLLRRLKKFKKDTVNTSIDYYIKILDLSLNCGLERKSEIFTAYGDVLIYPERMAGALDRLYRSEVFKSLEFSKEYLEGDHKNIVHTLSMVALEQNKEEVKEASDEIPNLYGLKEPGKEFSKWVEKEYKIKITKK